MDDKLKAWEERISQVPEDMESFREFLELLAECRIIEGRVG